MLYKPLTTLARVVEAFGKVLAVVVVAVKYPAVALLPRSEEPSTENFAPGVVVPIPTLPVDVTARIPPFDPPFAVISR